MSRRERDVERTGAMPASRPIGNGRAGAGRTTRLLPPRPSSELPAGDVVAAAELDVQLKPLREQTRRTDAEILGFPVQLRGDAALDEDQTRATAAAGVGSAGSSLPYREQIQASFGGYDVSGIQAHVGGAAGDAATAIGAEAFATGHHVAFRSPPDLHTAAHEAAHVIQQAGGVQLKGGVGQANDIHERHADQVADLVVQGKSAEALLAQYAPPGGRLPFHDVMLRTDSQGNHAVQMRRVPGDVAPLVDDARGGGEPANVDAHRAGLRLVIERAEATLKAADAKYGTVHFKNYMAEAMAGLPDDEIVEPGEMLVRKSKALRKVVPVLELGDPNQIEVGARPGTDDKRNLRKLVHNVTKVFDEIAGGGHDVALANVFGAEHVATAKRNYARARRELRRIVRDDELLSDRSGFAAEVGLGGQAWYQGPILLEASNIDNPDATESIRITIHEAMHAGNPGIHDEGNYAGSGDGFMREAAAVKLANAAL